MKPRKLNKKNTWAILVAIFLLCQFLQLRVSIRTELGRSSFEAPRHPFQLEVGRGLSSFDVAYQSKATSSLVPASAKVQVGSCDRSSPRHVDGIQLHVIGYERVESMKILLEQLQQSNYTGWAKDVPLHIHIDGGAKASVRKDFEQLNKIHWPHGPLEVNLKTENKGLRKMWLDSIGTAAKKAGDNTLLLVLEDDTRVSLDYFQWLLGMIDRYARQPACRKSGLVGFSLSPLLVQEMTKPFQPWNATSSIKRHFRTHSSAFLTTTPSSWGSAYWSDHWNEFSQFVGPRMEEPFYSIAAEKVKVKDYSHYKMSPEVLHVPGARSNVWPKSWKRFMVDFMFARGLVMMYPTLPGQQGLATALQEDGEHVDASKKKAKNPRVADLVELLDPTIWEHLPSYVNMPIYDLFLKPTTPQDLALQGAKFLQSVLQKCPECEGLVRHWAPSGLGLKGLANTPTQQPSVCMADLYTSASTFSSLPASASTEKYLFFEPQYGVNNQLQSVMEAYYWARALNRRLVLPPLFTPRVSDFTAENAIAEGIDFEKYFQLSDVDHPDLATGKALPNGRPGHMNELFEHTSKPPINYAEFAKLDQKPWRLLQITREAVFDESSVVLTPNLVNKDLEVVDLRLNRFRKGMEVEDVQNMFGGCHDDVLAFKGFFFAKMKRIDREVLGADVMHPTEEVTRLVETVRSKAQAELGSSEFACYHVRLGDFASMCEGITKIRDQVTTPKYACAVSKEELTATIEEKGLPAFVMSDDPVKMKDMLSNVSQKTITSDWVEETMKNNLERDATDNEKLLLSLVTEQMLCASANFSYLNQFSTVSRRIKHLRRGKRYTFWPNKQGLIEMAEAKARKAERKRKRKEAAAAKRAAKQARQEGRARRIAKRKEKKEKRKNAEAQSLAEGKNAKEEMHPKEKDGKAINLPAF